MQTRTEARPAETLRLDIYNERVVVVYRSTSGTHQITSVMDSFDRWKQFYTSKVNEARGHNILQVGIVASDSFMAARTHSNLQLRELVWNITWNN